MKLQDYDYKFFRVAAPHPFLAHVQIANPSRLNAFSRPVWLEFGRLFRQLSEDGDVRAVILSGEGDRAFTSGLDVKAAGGDEDGVFGDDKRDPARWAKGMRGHIEEFQECIGAMEKCEKPVICVLHDIAIGLAVDIACCADVRLATASTTLSVREVRIGLAADIGTLSRLPRLGVSHSWVKDVCLTGRDFTGEEALRQGFVSEVLPGKREALARAAELGRAVCELSPVAVQGTKELLNYGREHGVEESLRYTRVWNSVALQGGEGGDFGRALGASVRRKKPVFEKL